MEVWIVIAALGGLFAWRILSYNRFVLQLQQVQAAWAEIDMELRRRFDVIPELIELVRGHAGDRPELFEQVTASREAAASAAGSPAASAAALVPFESHLRRLVALAEDQPDLRSSEPFRRIEEELAMTEDRLAGRRGVYNGRVSDLNRRVRSFPSSVIARISGIDEAEYFRVKLPARPAAAVLPVATDEPPARPDLD